MRATLLILLLFATLLNCAAPVISGNSRSAKSITAGGGGGPDVWYYPGGLTDTDFTSGPTGAGYTPHLYAYGAAITVTTGGSCTKLRVRGIQDGSAPTVKISLFDASYNRLSSATADTVVVTTAGWYEVTLASPVTVSSSTTYNVVVSASNGNLGIYYNTGGDGHGTSVAYASFPPASLSPSTEGGTRFGVAMYVD